MAIFGQYFKALAQVEFFINFNKKYYFGIRRQRPFDLGLCKSNKKFRTHPNLHVYKASESNQISFVLE